MPATFLFTYGTLLQKDNEFAQYLAKHCDFYSPGKLHGVLYDIGDYPGLTINEDAGYVVGRLFGINSPEVIAQIDAYEGFGPDEQQPNLYKRVIQQIETNTGAVNAWVYVYNLPVEGLAVITSGDYLEYLGQKKSPGS